jgi:hypothetical protein
MRDEKSKQPNAQTHGVFAATAIIPGEDRQEFEELHSAVIQEWAPDGATEDDAVLTIAKGVWRKRRVQKFVAVQLLKNSHDPSHPSYNESAGLSCFAAAMRNRPEVAFEKWAHRCLRADQVKYLENKFPRSNFTSTPEWAQAVIDEITLVLLEDPANDVPEMADIAALSLSMATFSDDFIKQEIALDERLDATIDRAVKRLIQTKAMKQMLAQTSTERVEVQPRATVARRSSAERQLKASH